MPDDAQTPASAPAASVVASHADVAIIGAGPAGLFQAFQLGLLGLHAVVIDALPHTGGQCIELYPDKPIYDLPGLPVCTGRELVARLLTQLQPFHTPLWLGQAVAHLSPRPDGGFEVGTDQGARLHVRHVVVAAGAGAFTPRKPAVEGLAAFEGRQVFYHPDADPARFAGRDVLILGDEDPALEWALRLCAAHPDGHPHKARRVTLMHRRNVWRAAPATVDALQALHVAGHLDLCFGQITGLHTTAGHLDALTVLDAQGQEQARPVDLLLPLLGLSPRLGPLADWGLALERKQVPVDTTRGYESQVGGVFAIGDINTYPGKRKLIVCGFHEATLAAYTIAQRHLGEHPLHVQYTTTSAILQARLGVLAEDQNSCL